MPAFGLVVNHKDEILLIQRGYGKDKGKWSLPGGRRDKDESLKRAAVRETCEETGIRMSADSLYYRNKKGNLETWRGRIKGGHLKYQKKECLDAKWLQKDMLPHDACLAFGPDKIVIGKWAAENHGSSRVHYPRSKMRRAGFALIVNKQREVLLVQESKGARKGKWKLPGDITKHSESRSDAAKRGAYKAAGIKVAIDHLYYENRHSARIYLAKPVYSHKDNSYAKWFPLDELPHYKGLAFAVDVRTIEKWARENGNRKQRQGSDMLKKLLGSEDDKKRQADEWELIGTRFFDEEDFVDVSPWVQQQIKQICDKGLGDSPEELTHHFEGKVFAYRLDFDGPNGEILGVYRRQKSTLSQPNISKTKKSATPMKGPIYKFHRPEKWSDWVKDNVANIRKKPVPDGADNTVVHYLKGTHYRYKLDFPVVKSWGKLSLGTPVVYRRPRTWYWRKSQSSSQWQFVGMCNPNREIKNLSVPKWVRKQIKHLYEKNNSRTYLLKGKRYRYRLEFKTYSHANHELYVYKKPRTWYWKKLNG